jgi:alpha-L-rhamnosidase
VSAAGDRLTTGFSATRAAVRALADADGGTALLDAVRQPGQPGIGSMLTEGPGTFWETWWIDDENVGVASLDHIGLGAPFAAWAWTHVAGLRPLAPGFRRFALEPRLLTHVRRATVRRDTPRGRIEVEWRLQAGVFSADVVVPVGSTCVVIVPGHPDAHLDSGRHSLRIDEVAPPVRTTPAIAAPARPRRGETWLSDGTASVWRSRDRSVSVELVDQDTVCTPVFHESMPAPSLAITIGAFAPGRSYWIELERDGPLDLTEAAFVFASFDVDGGELAGRKVRPLLRLTSSGGDTRVGSARPLPIAWNRVTVDVADWPGRSIVEKVEVGLVWTDEHDPARGPYRPLPTAPVTFPFRVGRVGWTSAPRTY